MPEFTLWSPEQMKEREKPRRIQQREAKERIIAEYSEYFKTAGPGFGGQVVLTDEDDKRKIRSMVREAAERSGLALRFRPIKDKSRIEFAVVEPNNQPKPPTNGRRGRPRKTPK